MTEEYNKISSINKISTLTDYFHKLKL